MPDFIMEVLEGSETDKPPGAHEGKASKAKHQESSMGVILHHNAPHYQGHA